MKSLIAIELQSQSTPDINLAAKVQFFSEIRKKMATFRHFLV